MPSRTRKKYDEWIQKVRSHLNRKDKASLDELAIDCRYLRYWGQKLRKEEPESFAKIEKLHMRFNGQIGQTLHNDYSGFLKKAQKHGRGTKARLAEILRYVYYYGNYAHECFIEAGEEEEAAKILQSFWDLYGSEIMKYRDRLEDFQIDSVLRLAKHSVDIGIKIESQWISSLENLIRLPDPLLLAQCKSQLKKAEENLSQEETIIALVLADQSLELFLRGLCTRFGCDEDTLNKKGKPFRKWGFTDYVVFLSKIEEVDKYEKTGFFRFHEWRNSTYHLGLEPSVRLVRMVVDEIARFVDEHSY